MVAVVNPWKGKTVLITAGPTREYLDPVRFMTNASSGRMGFSLAAAARDWGARVILISGPTSVRPPRGVRWASVITARQMHRQVMRYLPQTDAVIGASAVGDWRFENMRNRKIKRGSEPFQVTLLPNPDILKEVGRKKQGRVIVGFALETDRWLQNAWKKLVEKKMDLVVANRPESMGRSPSRILILDRLGRQYRFPAMSKDQAAKVILKHAGRFFLN